MIEVKLYSEKDFSDWEDFVENQARNATFLHSRKFFQHNPINQLQDSSLIFTKKSNIIAVIPAVLIEKANCKVWNSHAYATYGGFVVSPKVGAAEAVEIVDLTIAFARERNVNELIVRNPFRIFNALPTDETDYAMWQRGFTVARRDLEIAIQLDGSTPEAVFDLYDGKTRNAVRKAERENIQVEICQDYEKFWQILTKNLSDRHSTKPVHSHEQFLILKNLVGDDKIKLFGAYLKSELIGGIVVFVVNKNAVHAQYIAGLDEFQSLRAINLLIHRICVWAIENDFSYFNLGMVNEPDGSGINDGLCKFKEGFGGRGVLRETMRLVLNDL